MMNVVWTGQNVKVIRIVLTQFLLHYNSYLLLHNIHPLKTFIIIKLAFISNSFVVVKDTMAHLIQFVFSRVYRQILMNFSTICLYDSYFI